MPSAPPNLASTPSATTSSGHPVWLLGPHWEEDRFAQPGWLLLPLRGFLGVTFLYASLQKLANPSYLNASNPSSVASQMAALRHSSPIGPVLGLSLHAPTLVGLAIAIGELAVGVGVLVGLWTRLAAAGGMALSLMFFLTVSWSTTPYYYGSDLVFVFAWTVVAGFGTAGVLSLDALLDVRTRHAPSPINQRRRELAGRLTIVVGAIALGLGGATALIGRLVGGTKSSAGTGLRLPSTSAPTGSTAGPTPTGSPRRRHRHAPGTPVGAAAAVPVGQAARFTDPASGQPAYVVHTAANNFVAFSAICTHAGCTLRYDAADHEFVCPCHGGRYDAKTGQVVAGPPPSPLPVIAIHVVNGTIRAD
jgi:thiosulfate dehydrogenase [quinone] large subunit